MVDKTPTEGATMGAAIAAAAASQAALEGLTQAVAGQQASLPGILDAARAGDGDAFAALVRRFERPVYHLIVRMVRRPSVAEDLAQDVFVRLWRHLAEFESAATLAGWLRRVAVNAVIDHWRKEDARRRRLQALREHPLARLALGPSSRLESHEALDLVDAALEQLPAKLRSVLALRTAEGMAYDELAEVLGTSASAVRSRLFRARRELHEALKRLKAPEYLARMYRPPRPKGRP
jgi:RNA polymerase sigma-70 factor (ECF subfamily)